MRHQKKVHKLSKKAAHRKLMLANMAVSLFIHGEIKTTTAKAKALREFAERLITFAKKGDVHSRRIVLAKLKTSSRAKKDAVNFLFDKIAPLYYDRNGGYLRILKYGFRKGDNAEISLVKLINAEGLNYNEYINRKGKKKASASVEKVESSAEKQEELNNKKEEVAENKEVKTEETETKNSDVEVKEDSQSADKVEESPTTEEESTENK